MKKKLLLSIVGFIIFPVVTKTPPPLPSFTLEVQRALAQPDQKSAQTTFEELTFYRLVESMRQNVYFIQNNPDLTKINMYDFFSKIYQDTESLSTKTAALTNQKSLSTVPGFAHACYELLQNAL